jgi:hypothetical protein
MEAAYSSEAIMSTYKKCGVTAHKTTICDIISSSGGISNL